MSVVFCGRIDNELAARIDARLGQAGLKNRSQVVAAALEAWVTAQEGGQSLSLEDRLAVRLEQVIKQELARVRVTGAGLPEPPDPHADKRRAFLKAGRR